VSLAQFRLIKRQNIRAVDVPNKRFDDLCGKPHGLTVPQSILLRADEVIE